MVEGGEVVRLPVYLPKELHKALMHRAVDEERSASQILVDLVRDYLERPAKKKGGKGGAA